MSKQLEKFDTSFVKNAMRDWTNISAKYETEAGTVYKRIRSYLTLYQFRLTEQEKCDIREMLSQELDEIESSANIVDEMDSFLEGYCFKFDKSVLPKPHPTEVKVEIAPETIQQKPSNSAQKYNPTPPSTQSTCSETTTDNLSDSDTNTDTDFDFFTYQFFQ